MAYLDHAATTPMRASVRQALIDAGPIMNPNSTHRSGQAANAVLESARERLAATLGAHPSEIVFTSGGTESINLALKGLWFAHGGAIVLPDGEHHATLDTVEWLERKGAEVRGVPIDRVGRIDAAAFEAALVGAGLATMLLANNETGTMQPVERLAVSARDAGVPLHVDAVAAFGHVPIDVRALGAPLLSIAAHKIGGPVGIGALVVDRAVAPEPLLHGGASERGIRSGTPDTLGAHLFAIAAEEAMCEMSAEASRLRAMTDRILAAATAIEGVSASADADRLPGTAHIVIDGVDGATVQFLLDAQGIEVSNGSACTAGVVQESHVLRAMGYSGRYGPVRISLGHTTSDDDVDRLIAALPRAIEQALAAQGGHGLR